MKAAVLFKPNEPLQVVDCELDPPKAGEVRVKMKASGVCQSDWHVMNGDWPSPLPIVPGHEAAGEIAECGAGVTTVKPGDHVIFSFRPHCGPRCAALSSSLRRWAATTAQWALNSTFRLDNIPA